jgi:hypothetical protein
VSKAGWDETARSSGKAGGGQISGGQGNRAKELWPQRDTRSAVTVFGTASLVRRGLAGDALAVESTGLELLTILRQTRIKSRDCTHP